MTVVQVETEVATPNPPPATRRRGVPRVALNLISIAVGIGIWWGFSATGFDIPTPPSVVKRGWELLADGTLEGDILASLRRVLIGFVIGVVLAVPVGFLMGWYPIARGLIEPWVQFFRVTPPLAILPLVIVLLGIEETPKIFVIAVASFLSCVIATFQGVVSIDRTMINAARVLGARDGTIFARVAVPASTPFIVVGMRVGLGASWSTLVAAELIAAQQGLGYRIQSAEIYYDLPTIFVGIITIGLIGLLMDALLLVVQRRVTNWQEVR